ncbi:hypothetical protein Poli38472_001614 [Pythium oligandrum]|uniref:Purple acid phosphatase n=1 Tax=Pythium oligandrum TaxID=41045 RepID=A0A8K1CWD0_PYTOL|nr:hypothetical protein Poli38472_001614 [Pythium oligandrum]|eukprot:TMW69458.1 hypothetical protein Poli38472_001614 [Pythium oligandrum]
MLATTLVLALCAGAAAQKLATEYAHEDALAFAATLTRHAPVWLADEGVLASPWDALEDSLRTVDDDDDDGDGDSSVVLTAYPPVINDGEDLVVSWSGVPSPHAKDFVALSCGPRMHSRDFLATVNVDPSTPSVRFPSLYMMRCNYSVVYFNYNPKVADVRALAELQIAMKESFNAPKQGHIALTSQKDEMAVMFNSASMKTPQVRYGTTPDALTNIASGTFTTYKASDMCEAPANITAQVWFRDPGYMHKVILKKLTLGTRYFYCFGNDEDGWSSVYSFKSRPDSSVQTAKFIAYADMGVESAPAATSTAVRSYQDVLNGYDDFLLHFGDISYARGHAHMWDEFFHIIEPYATRVPYMVSIGNHEYDYMTGGKAHDPSGAAGDDDRMNFHPGWANYGDDSSGECSVPMFHRWHAPENGHGIYWYSFDYGGVHVIQMSSEHNWMRGSEQYKWIENDLKNVDRSKTPWVVLTAHRMMYTTQLGEDADLNVSKYYRKEMEDLLWTYKVNLMLVGHQHSYERSCAVRDGKCTKDDVGPVHIIVGSAGAGLETRGFSKDIGEWSVAHVNDWGYLRVASTPSEMKIQFVLNRNGVVYDEVTLPLWK